VADLGAYEAAANPDHGVIETDPYGLVAEPGALVATDAAGNSLLRIGANGSISTIAIFPSRAQGRTTDSVPTTVAVRGGNDESDDDDDNGDNKNNNGRNKGDDGRQTYYVGELTGDPFVPGTANIYRVVHGQATVWKTGFSFIIDMAFARDGSLYVLELASGPGLAPPGDLWRIAPNGTRSLVATGFVFPNGLAIGRDRAIYVSQNSIFPGTGQVVRITP
jgi:hypothetical protein